MFNLQTFWTNFQHKLDISICIENTNYFVTTSIGEFVLTLFEHLNSDELPYFLELMAYLAEHNIPSAHPVADKQGCYLRQLNGKPAALVERLQRAGLYPRTVVQRRETIELAAQSNKTPLTD